MHRSLALLVGMVVACLAIASTGFAANLGQIRFTISDDQRSNRLQLRLTEHSPKGGLSSSGFNLQELTGLQRAALHGVRSAPISFALVREPGRIDCTGTAGAGRGSGQCRFSANTAFSDMLASRGVGRPDERQALGLTMVGATRALVDALANAQYRTPSIDQLTGLAALDVSPSYVAELASSGYPAKLDDLMSFRALDISPAYIDGMTRSGFPGLTAGDIVQFKALDISPQYVTSMRTAGLGRLTADELVQLKALNVTPVFITGFRELGYELPVPKLIECKALGVTPEFVRSLQQGSRGRISADDLIKLKVVGLTR